MTCFPTDTYGKNLLLGRLSIVYCLSSKSEQLAKALSAIHVKPLPIVTDFKLIQGENAEAPMLVTLFGMVTDVLFLQGKGTISS